MCCKWFDVSKLPSDVYAILEPHHFQEVISYLIIGTTASVLFDTGMGIGDIEKVVKEIYQGELIVINSHSHFDHVGGNHFFKEVLVYNDVNSVARLKRGYEPDELAPHIKPKLFAKGYYERFAPEAYRILPSNPKTVEDGFIIDLGSRLIKIIHTPGHSPDSIMLLDMDNMILFTGDSYYPGHLYAHYEGEFYGSSQIETYAKSMQKISNLAKDLSLIHPGHNNPTDDPRVLEKVSKALKALADGLIEKKEHLYGDLSIASLPDSGEEVKGYVVPDDLYVYDYDGLKIIARGM